MQKRYKYRCHFYNSDQMTCNWSHDDDHKTMLNGRARTSGQKNKTYKANTESRKPVSNIYFKCAITCHSTRCPIKNVVFLGSSKKLIWTQHGNPYTSIHEICNISPQTTKIYLFFFAQNVQYFCKNVLFTPRRLISFPIKLQMFGFNFRFLHMA